MAAVMTGTGPGGPPAPNDPPAPGGPPARSRGVIALLEENCTVCMLCARECPDWCIYIESHKEPVPGHEYGVGGSGGGPGHEYGATGSGGPAPAVAPAGRGRQRVRNVLD